MGNGNEPTNTIDPSESTGARRLSFDATKAARDFRVVLSFAIIGFLGCIVLFLMGFPPILVSVFLATGVASLVYGFLGGIEASFNLGTLQVTGSLAALLGCAWLVNGYLVEQINARPVIEGYFMDMSAQTVPPFEVGDPALVVQRIEPENPRDIFVQWEEDSDFMNSTKEIGWRMAPQPGSSVAILEFQHSYEVWTRMDTRPPGLPRSDPASSECGAIRGDFLKQCGTENKALVLNLADLRRGRGMSFIYRAHETDPERKIGHFSRRRPDGTLVPIEWATEEMARDLATASLDAPARSHWLSQAYAAPEQKQEMFRPDGQYDERMGRVLRQRLGQPDLKAQAYARDILVQGGSRAFRFIGESIAASRSERGFDRSILLHNLSLALEEIGRLGAVIPNELLTQMADALYEMGDFEGAGAIYARVPDEAVDDPDVLLRKGYSFSATSDFERAVNSYEAFLAGADTPEEQAVAHGNLAGIYAEVGDLDQAARHFEMAMEAQPELPDSYNNLAWLYAENGVELGRALELADRALELAPDDPSLLDTKGWIFFKMGDLGQALEILERAAELAPNHPEIISHLETVRREIG